MKRIISVSNLSLGVKRELCESEVAPAVTFEAKTLGLRKEKRQKKQCFEYGVSTEYRRDKQHG